MRRFCLPASSTLLLLLLLSSLASASAPCQLNPTNQTVTICTPAANDFVQSPVHVVAGTTDSNMVTTMYIFVDNVLAYKVSGSTVDTFVNLGVGHHSLMVQAKDSTKKTFKQNFAVIMQPPCALNASNQTI